MLVCVCIYMWCVYTHTHTSIYVYMYKFVPKYSRVKNAMIYLSIPCYSKCDT